jgi:hypothetical protein
MLLALVGAITWLAFHLGNRTFSAANTQLLRDIDTYRNVLNTVSDERVRSPGQRRKLQAIVDRTLGGDLETVDAALRAGLNRIGEEIGLAGLSVRTGTAATRLSPARSEFRGAARRDLRDEPDFVELEAWISGQGDLRQSLQLLHRLQHETWMKKILQVKLSPKDNGARFDVNLHLVTLFLPGHAPDPAQGSIPYDPSGFEHYATLVSANAFRVPPEQPAQVVAQAKPPPAPPPAPPPFPYEKWWLTGIAQGPVGMEVWLLNRESGESRRLGSGERLHEAMLVAARGEQAEFEVLQQRFSVAVGQNLGDRRLIERPGDHKQ